MIFSSALRALPVQQQQADDSLTTFLVQHEFSRTCTPTFARLYGCLSRPVALVALTASVTGALSLDPRVEPCGLDRTRVCGWICLSEYHEEV